MTTWPSGSKATTTHTDAGSDKPRLARVDINQNILNVNDIIDYLNGGGSVTLTGNQISFNKGYKETINTLTSSASITVDAGTASVHKVTLAHNATFSFTNLVAGSSVSIIITQDGTGNRLGTFTDVRFPAGTVTSLSTAANKIDILNIFYDGTNKFGTVNRDMTA
jgi:hypothetical protein